MNQLCNTARERSDRQTAATLSPARRTDRGKQKLSPGFHTAHHFPTADVQFDAGRMGVWLFLVTEILLFGGLFCAFAVFRNWYFDSFVEAHHHLNKVMALLFCAKEQ